VLDAATNAVVIVQDCVDDATAEPAVPKSVEPLKSWRLLNAGSEVVAVEVETSVTVRSVILTGSMFDVSWKR